MIENENNFESLRRVLALKRHEVPPPGYFDSFSSRVIQRIQAGEQPRFETPGLLTRLQQMFQVQPAFASGFAGALCLLLLFGIVYAERPELAAQPLIRPDAGAAPLATLSPAALSTGSASVGIVSSTNPVLNLQSLASTTPAFTPQNPFIQSAGFTLPGQ